MQKQKRNTLALASVLALTFLGARTAAARQPVTQSQNEQASKKEPAPDSAFYRVSYKVEEAENGKTINSRSYTLMVKTNSRASGRVGSQIPIATGEGAQIQYQYQDVGMNVDCMLTKHEEGLIVYTKISLSTVRDKERSTSTMAPPVLRHLSLEDDTIATPGKPAFVGSIDDVASNRRYVIEVTVTKAE